MTVLPQSVIAAGVGAGTTFFAVYGTTGSIVSAGVAAGSAFFGGLGGAALHSAYSTNSITPAVPAGKGGSTPPSS